MWNLPGPGIEPVSPALAGRFFTTGSPGKSQTTFWVLFSLKLSPLGYWLHYTVGPWTAALASSGRLMHACSVAQSYLTLCNPMGCNPPGSSVRGDSPTQESRTHISWVSCIGRQILYPCTTREAWMLDRNAEFSGLPQIYWSRICILTRFPGTICRHITVWNELVQNTLKVPSGITIWGNKVAILLYILCCVMCYKCAVLSCSVESDSLQPCGL